MNSIAISASSLTASTEPQLVRVFTGVIGCASVSVVDARELHAYLEVGRDFATWLNERVEKYGFQQDQDFSVFSPDKGKKRGRPRIDYHLSLDMAKELSMVENNEQGRKARRYFIDMERKALAAVGQYVPTLSSDTLLPSEQQTLTEVVHRKAATCGQQQGKAIAEIWSRVHRKFRVSRYAQLRREQLADVIHYVTQMTLRTPGATNSPQLHDTLNETVAHLVRHVESPNGAPAVVFMPLVNAVLRKQGFDLGARQVIDGEQAREIEDRLGRLMGLFHPMSAPFGDACGILRALRGLHPRLGTAEPSYLPVLGRA